MAFICTLDRMLAPHWGRVMTSPVAQHLGGPEATVQAYIGYLQNVWHHVRHTPRKLALAAWRCGPEQRGLRDRLSSHSREEIGHDDWILSDLEALGVAPEETTEMQATPAMTALIAHGYYLAGMEHPATILAEAYFVEKLSQGQASGVAAKLRAQLGIPTTATTFLEGHGELDQDHAGEYVHVFRQLLDDDGRLAVLSAAPASGWTYASAYEAMDLIPNRASLREAV